MVTLSGCVLLSAFAQAEDAIESVSLEAVRVLAGDGFERRDTRWRGQIPTGEARTHKVFLYKQNEYCFLLADAGRLEGVKFAIYNSKGELIDAGTFHRADRTLRGLHLRPPTSGVYYIRIVNDDNATASVALTYCFR